VLGEYIAYYLDIFGWLLV